MSREVPYNDDLNCDICNKSGAFDFMGDYYCENCLHICAGCGHLFITKGLCEDCKREKSNQQRREVG